MERTFSHLFGRICVNAVNTKSTKTDEKYEVQFSNGVDSNVPTCARLFHVSSEIIFDQPGNDHDLLLESKDEARQRMGSFKHGLR